MQKKSTLLLTPWQSCCTHSSSSSWSSSATLICPSYNVSLSANIFCLSNLLSLNFRTSMGDLRGSAFKGKDKRDSPTVQKMSQKHRAVPTGCQRLQVWGAGGVSGSPGCCSPQCILRKLSENIIPIVSFFCSRRLSKHIAVGIILHLYWNTVPSGAENCSCLIAHSSITQTDGKESEMC